MNPRRRGQEAVDTDIDIGTRQPGKAGWPGQTRFGLTEAQADTDRCQQQAKLGTGFHEASIVSISIIAAEKGRAASRPAIAIRRHL
jgi:hypothetical protein